MVAGHEEPAFVSTAQVPALNGNSGSRSKTSSRTAGHHVAMMAAGQGFGKPKGGRNSAKFPDPTKVNKNDLSIIEPGRMALAFTCKECETRIAKKITKQAYEKGVVIIECPGCQARHLIADNLGWYRDWTDDGSMKNVEDFAERNGEVVRKVSRNDIAVQADGSPL